MSLDPPYNAKNGPLDSIEELLFVQGVTPQLLFGNDRTATASSIPTRTTAPATSTWVGRPT